MENGVIYAKADVSGKLSGVGKIARKFKHFSGVRRVGDVAIDNVLHARVLVNLSII